MRVFQTILYKKVNGKLTAAIMPLHMTQPQKKYKSGLGAGVPRRTVRYGVIHYTKA